MRIWYIRVYICRYCGTIRLVTPQDGDWSRTLHQLNLKPSLLLFISPLAHLAHSSFWLDKSAMHCTHREPCMECIHSGAKAAAGAASGLGGHVYRDSRMHANVHGWPAYVAYGNAFWQKHDFVLDLKLNVRCAMPNALQNQKGKQCNRLSTSPSTLTLTLTLALTLTLMLHRLWSTIQIENFEKCSV